MYIDIDIQGERERDINKRSQSIMSPRTPLGPQGSPSQSLPRGRVAPDATTTTTSNNNMILLLIIIIIIININTNHNNNNNNTLAPIGGAPSRDKNFKGRAL